ncbi:alpha/beta hydrolase [Natronobacterium gregoryi]|uniref:Esterase n=2 Tax=Natronobacterium gregoryi TaxID=44930 RepID=L0AHX7_NATGS|nr:dienelactone hydrolase family protein [Natronobacterium gregoryi]AFZ72767.1 putative esterase [Natronobacterium gregoryi SP2]ELY69468.1 phospholipase/carboxylesterase [Natronobacterium gregoryi SP2]PLK21110.1 phospholipase [Natronobacterium gregoryi SP2]SFJ11334.1 phospholipase/carboxylesterase [Natronobacterium gregoryi]
MSRRGRREGPGSGHQGEDPHGDQPLVSAGTELEDAEAAVVLVHGRGATARSIIGMADEIHQAGVAFLAPQAAANTWYPNSFLEPVEHNEPGRTSGLKAVENAIGEADDAGIPAERVLVLGFSQGACLASEFVARNPRRYGGLAALSGGLIGDELEDTEAYAREGSLEGTPAFLGCSDSDPHIPVERVHETADVIEKLDADVTTRIYEGMGHGVNRDELAAVSELVASLLEDE